MDRVLPLPLPDDISRRGAAKTAPAEQAASWAPAELGFGTWNEFAAGEFYEGMSKHHASFLGQPGYDLKDGLDL